MDDPYSTMMYGQERNADALSEVFHESTKFTAANFLTRGLQISTYLRSRAWIIRTAVNHKRYSTRRELTLPEPTPLATPLGEALKLRCSARAFKQGTTATLQQISNILIHATGVTHESVVPNFPKITFKHRPYPSAGALYPVELYAALINVEDVSPCILHFNPTLGRTTLMAEDLDVDVLGKALGERTLARAVAAVFIVTGVFQRATVKYGDRGYRFALLEAGHLVQNLDLVAHAEKLGGLCWGGYFDDRVNSLVEANGVDEAVVHCLLVGQTS